MLKPEGMSDGREFVTNFQRGHVSKFQIGNLVEFIVVMQMLFENSLRLLGDLEKGDVVLVTQCEKLDGHALVIAIDRKDMRCGTIAHNVCVRHANTLEATDLGGVNHEPGAG